MSSTSTLWFLETRILLRENSAVRKSSKSIAIVLKSSFKRRRILKIKSWLKRWYLVITRDKVSMLMSLKRLFNRTRSLVLFQMKSKMLICHTKRGHKSWKTVKTSQLTSLLKKQETSLPTLSLLHQTLMKQEMSKRLAPSNQWSSRVTLRPSEVDMNVKPRPKSLPREQILKSWRNLCTKLTSLPECHHRRRINQRPNWIWRLILASSKKLMESLNRMELWEEVLELDMAPLRSTKRSTWVLTTKTLLIKRVKTPKTLLHLKRWKSRRVTSHNCNPLKTVLVKICP